MKIKLLFLLCLTGFLNVLVVGSVRANQTNVDATVSAFIGRFTWSKPIEDLSLGVSFIRPADRFGDKSDVLIYLLDIGQTNKSKWWIGPPKFQRCEYYLYDSLGKVTPYLTTYHPANKVYKTISEVPKNIHNVYIGLTGPYKETPVPYDRITLTNIFQIEHGGDYKLVAKGRLMKINDDGSLSVIEFPLVSIPVHLDQSP
jgi:hypothetical protein